METDAGRELTTTTADEKEKLWALAAHVSFFVFALVGPALIMALQETLVGRQSEYVARHAKQALFWQLGALIISMVSCGLGFFVMAIWAIQATIAANKGEAYTYPLLDSIE